MTRSVSYFRDHLATLGPAISNEKEEMTMRIRDFCLGIMLAAIFGIGAALAQPVKIGFMNTFTGPGGMLGSEQYDGFMLAVELAGGKLGNRDVEVIKVDDQLKPDVARQLVDRLLTRDKVDIVVGVTFSNILQTVVGPVTAAGKIFISSNAGPSPYAGAQCNPSLFVISYENGQAHSAVGEYLNQQGVKRVSTMVPNYQAGKDAMAGFRSTFKGEVIQELYTSLQQLDFTTELTAIRNAKPDAFWAFMPGGLGVALVKQVSEARLQDVVPFYSSFTVDELSLPAMGEAAIGNLSPYTWSPDLENPANARFVAGFKKKYNRIPSLGAMQAYDVAQLIDSAIKATGGKLDRDALIAAMRKANFASPRGAFKFNKNHFPIQDWYMRIAEKGPDGPRMVNKAKVFQNLVDRFHQDCKMKW
jgi:branched-chain amino acid transport system substrate-binding protein